jgi:type IV secretion system protein VirB1
LQAVAKTESGFDPWALHDNTTGVSDKPASLQDALGEAWSWIDRGDSVDVGLMQINSGNFSALGLTARSALDACSSMAAGAAVLNAAYGSGQASPDHEVALLMALSRYNTGSPLKGIMNGYARTVMNNATDDDPLSPPDGSSVSASGDVITDPNAPPSWDISATAAFAQAHGAPWLVSLAPSPSPQATAPSPANVASVQPAPTAPPAAQPASSALPPKAIQ